MRTAVIPERRVLLPTQVTRAQLHGLGSSLTMVTAEGATMGTYWALKALVPDQDGRARCTHCVQAAFDHVVRQMSGWSATSDLTRFNQAPAGTWHSLPADFFRVLQRACELAEDSQGAYDPTVGEVVDLLGFGPRGPDVTLDEPALHNARRRVGWKALRLDPENQRAFQAGGVCVDLSSIAKGYAVDLAADALMAAGVDNFLLEIGGEVRARGCKPDGQPWWCWVERPPAGPDVEALPETVVGLCDGALATSGSYRRYRDARGRRWSHLIDPRTGESLSDDLVSVSVFAPSCMDADGYATVLYVLGVEEGFRWATARNVAALFVFRSAKGLAERGTPAWNAMGE
ncbi:MAG TPA: FAD:protein FMN transferase [Opitutaceae bacterium]|nr:FAD:protein FMN transferase [Opitutaceae bacterium]